MGLIKIEQITGPQKWEFNGEKIVVCNSGLKRLSVLPEKLKKFEELATNCILHKEYENNSYIGIYVYSDKITFVKTRDEEGVNGSENDTTTKTTIKISKEDLIIKMIQDNSQITAEELAEKLGISVNGVRYYIKKLKKEEIIVRVGSTKTGYWKLIR